MTETLQVPNTPRVFHPFGRQPLGPTPFLSAWTKLIRALDHRYALETELREVLDPSRTAITFKTEVEWEEPPFHSVLLVVEEVPELALQFGAMVGDLIHNLRSAVDHLAWRLVEIGREPRPKQPRDVRFPMASSEPDLMRKASGALPGVAKSPHLALVGRFQPYLSDPRGEAMRNLQDLSNTDKHRVIVPAVIGIAGGDLELDRRNCTIRESETLVRGGDALEPGTPVARALIEGRVGKYEVHVHGEFRVQPALGDGRSMARVLRHIEVVVLDLLDAFDRLVEGGHYEPTAPWLRVDRTQFEDPLVGLI